MRVVATTGGKLAEAARAAGVPVIGIPSGLQPRAAVGYMFAIAAETATVIEAAAPIRTEIDAAAAWLDEQRDALVARSVEVAGALADRVPVIYGCDLTVPVAYRWKTQINENAKQHAFTHELPELDHNEIVGWDSADGGGSFAAVFLEDSDQHPRQRERAEHTARLIAPGASDVLRIETEGETRTARLLWSVMLGRSRLAAPGRASGDRPLAGGGHRAPQGRARAARVSDSQPGGASVWLAGPDELDAITSLIAGFRDWFRKSEPTNDEIRRSVERIAASGDGEYLLAAAGGSEPAGVCQLRYRWSVWTSAEDCWLEDLFVLDAARRAGLGRALVEGAAGRATERGCRRIELDVNEDNAAALALYEACGFTLEPKPPGRTLFLGRRL